MACGAFESFLAQDSPPPTMGFGWAEMRLPGPVGNKSRPFLL
jgi:hypothetical protein